jgi:hypothetical protein
MEDRAMDEAVKLANWVGANYGLLPAYAIIISMGAIIATSTKHLLFMLSIMAGVYVVMFQTFSLQMKLLPVDIAALLTAQGVPAAFSADLVNKIAAIIFVYVIGFTIYGLKRLAVPAEA